MTTTYTIKMPTPSSTHHNATLTSQKYSSDINDATTTINAFMPWLLIIVGSVCNVFIILGMRNSKFRSLSTSVFMTVGAFNNLTSLVILLVAHWVHLNFPNSIVRSKGADILCKFFNFYGPGQADLGIMLMSAMTADRAYAILRPLTSVDLVKRAKIVIGVCVAVVMVKEFHFCFTSVIVDEKRKDRLCDVDYNVTSYYDFYVNYWPWIDTVFVTLCFVVMVTSNAVIIRHVQKSRKGRQLQTREDNSSTGGPPRTRSSSTMTVHGGEKVAQQVTRMLLAESLAFILLSYPFSLHLVVTSQIQDPHTDPENGKANALAFSVVFYLLYANKCVNFFVYCISGKKFRKTILNDVLCRLQCCRFLIRKAKNRAESVSTQETHTCRREKVQEIQHYSEDNSQL
ncbi:growth hormone secretagogue receptor type 1-like [Littorina saxatilis]|uniref:G-protein coupled receptors family 1 profile domain-containing protein n=1 Tax=Littorina saxatilis TaxID=31220 RepID=A0AAN9G3K0_9CAEN